MTAADPGAPDRSADLRRVFRGTAASVAVVTAVHRGQPVGLLVTSLASLSTDPPLVTFNVARASSSWPALEVVDVVGLHVLSAGQRALAERFARSGADRFAPPTSWSMGPDGVPVLDHVASASVVEVRTRVDVADHVIVVGELVRADVRPDVPPLLHHDGAFHVLRSEPLSGQPSRLHVVPGGRR